MIVKKTALLSDIQISKLNSLVYKEFMLIGLICCNNTELQFCVVDEGCVPAALGRCFFYII